MNKKKTEKIMKKIDIEKIFPFSLRRLFMVIQPSAANKVDLSEIGSGWASNSVNTTIFRYNSVFSKSNIQVCAWYNRDKRVVLAKRELRLDSDQRNKEASEWKTNVTPFTGNTNDAHNIISLIIDTEGYIHMSWDHHVNRIRYARSLEPFDIENFSDAIPKPLRERRLTYPEFYDDNNGGLFFLFRTGSSGAGNLVLNHYGHQDRSEKYEWQTLHENLISGRGRWTLMNLLHPFRRVMNAYWQAAVDDEGGLHISWVWRDSPDAATNHDICYACSPEGGNKWKRSDGTPYDLPITSESAEIIVKIPRKSSLINTGTMAIASKKRPLIATYWKAEGDRAPQYKLVYNDGREWKTSTIYERNLDFSLSGFGSLKIPISRPRVLVDDEDNVYYIYRDDEEGGKVSVRICKNIWSDDPNWEHLFLTETNVGKWEPTIDMNLWREKNILHIFLQNVDQPKHEEKAKPSSSPVYILEWNPKSL